jgi:hypothetical protein
MRVDTGILLNFGPLVQDFFDMNLLPAGTDYEIFRDHAGLPGLDIAFLLGAQVYHTHQDTWERIRPGTLQVLLKACACTCVNRPRPTIIAKSASTHIRSKDCAFCRVLIHIQYLHALYQASGSHESDIFAH